MVFDLRDTGEPIQVALPEDEVIAGSLEQLTISGRAETETTPGGSATTTTTTAAATTETTAVP
jgi:hypothetical protein